MGRHGSSLAICSVVERDRHLWTISGYLHYRLTRGCHVWWVLLQHSASLWKESCHPQTEYIPGSREADGWRWGHSSFTDPPAPALRDRVWSVFTEHLAQPCPVLSTEPIHKLVIYKDVGSLRGTFHLSSFESFVLFWPRILGEKQPQLEKKPRDSYRPWQLQAQGPFCFLQGLRKISSFCVTPSLHRDCTLDPSFFWSRSCFPGSRGESWVNSFLCQKASQRFLLKPVQVPRVWKSHVSFWSLELFGR